MSGFSASFNAGGGAACFLILWGAGLAARQSPLHHVEESAAPLAVDVQSHQTPQGVPLHEVLAAVQKEVPSVQGMVIRNGNVVLTHAVAPAAADQQKINRILSNPQLLKSGTATAAPGADPLVKKLTDAATPDAEWIKSFREYAVKFLIKG